jgi:hypothetical protein
MPDPAISSAFKRSSQEFVCDQLLQHVEQPMFYYAERSKSFVCDFGETVRLFVTMMLQEVLAGEESKVKFVQRLIQLANKSSFPVASLFILQGIVDADGFNCMENKEIDLIVEIMTHDSQRIKWG